MSIRRRDLVVGGTALALGAALWELLIGKLRILSGDGEDRPTIRVRSGSIIVAVDSPGDFVGGTNGKFTVSGRGNQKPRGFYLRVPTLQKSHNVKKDDIVTVLFADASAPPQTLKVKVAIENDEAIVTLPNAKKTDADYESILEVAGNWALHKVQVHDRQGRLDLDVTLEDTCRFGSVELQPKRS